jgi:hypothetical protein
MHTPSQSTTSQLYIYLHHEKYWEFNVILNPINVQA